MSAILVSTDSVSGFSREQAAMHNIFLVPVASLYLDERRYIDGVDITPVEVYTYLEQNPDGFRAITLPPSYFADLFRQELTDGKAVFHVGLSANLSAACHLVAGGLGTLQEEKPELKFRVLDSRTASASQALLAIAASKAASEGMLLDELEGYIGRLREKTGGVLMLDTLRYVYRTGRISKAAAKLVTLLRIKPVSRITDTGTVEVVSKVRKREDGYRKMLELIASEAETEALHFIVAHAAAPELAEQLVALLRQRFECLSVTTIGFSPIMGYGSGRGALYIGFHPEPDLFK